VALASIIACGVVVPQPAGAYASPAQHEQQSMHVVGVQSMGRTVSQHTQQFVVIFLQTSY
jgi:hypothetical protein